MLAISQGGGLDKNTDRKIYTALKCNLLSQKYYFKILFENTISKP